MQVLKCEGVSTEVGGSLSVGHVTNTLYRDDTED